MNHVSKHRDLTKDIKTLTEFKKGDEVIWYFGTTPYYHTVSHCIEDKVYFTDEGWMPKDSCILRAKAQLEQPEQAPALNTQIGGNHYKTMGIQPLEACYQNFGYMGLKASIYTKVLKYFRTKDNEVEDIKKAIHAMQILLEKAELEAQNN